METMIGLICLILAANLHSGDAVDKLKLSSGHDIPVIGLGTFRLNQVEESITNALEIGYRHIDTAFFYKNEAAIGAALKKWFQKGGKRDDIFITSKLPPHANRADSVEKYLKKSLDDLDLEFVDMYLIHAPFGIKEGDNFSPAIGMNGSQIFEIADHVALWQKMEEQVTAGRAKSIGLSNFNQTQILNVYNNAKIKPSNLQVESHAYFKQTELREFCKKHSIVMTAYAPLGSPNTANELHKGTSKELPSLIGLPEIKEIAHKYNKTAAQVLLRHVVQAGIVAIPKSSNKDRQRENFDIFDFTLSEEDIEKINKLEKGEKGRFFDFLGINKELLKHPQYPISS
ncbi:unnamed protein product [Bemisia tabaci]|uniref:NADP-dependent oxidoreductase domain-containing protein n=2 Tax=Bemisia tabaci TaxID=7038 RepID=A0A9P0AK85_BEMTA|nr:unnamed protein product [Bemisia tabaci]